MIPTLGPRAYLFRYPVFGRYPKFTVDFQLKERERIAAEEEVLERKRVLLENLESRQNRLQSEDKSWREEQQRLLQAEAARRAESLELEARRLAERQRIDAGAHQRRLEHVQQMEARASDAIAQQKLVRQAEADRQRDESERSKRQLECVRTNLSCP